MINHRHFSSLSCLTAFLALMGGCGERSESYRSQLQASQGAVVAGEDLERTSSKESAAEARQLFLKTQSELKAIEGLNKGYCELVNRLSESCVASQHLRLEDSDVVRSCHQLSGHSLQAEHSVVMEGPGSVVLSVEHLFTTTPATAEVSKVDWLSLAGSQKLTPRLADVVNLSLQTKDQVEDMKVSYFINDQLIFNESHLEKSENVDHSYRVKPSRLLELSTVAECQPPRTEVVDLQQAARKIKADQATSVDPNLDAQEVSRAYQLLLVDLDIALDLNSKLIVNLLGSAGKGCHLSDPLKSLEFFVQGDLIEENLYLGASSSPLQSRGDTDRFEITLGDQVFISNLESENSLFSPMGHLVVSDFKDLKLASLRTLKIERKGTSYYSKAFKTGGFLGFGQKTKYHNYEVKRRNLQKFEIRNKGLLVYSKPKIDFSFRHDSLVWEDPSFLENDAYLKMVLKEDCLAE